MPRLGQLDRETVGRLRPRVAQEPTTTFATTYGAEGPLGQVAHPATMATYAAQRTGGKYLVRLDLG